MCKFKVGDTVRRIEGEWGSHIRGDEDVVIEVSKCGGLYFEYDPDRLHDESNYKLVRSTYPNPPHKHAEVIKAWADGAEVEYRVGNDKWHGASTPTWDLCKDYRIKPSTTPQELEKQEIIKEMEALKQRLDKLEV